MTRGMLEPARAELLAPELPGPTRSPYRAGGGVASGLEPCVFCLIIAGASPAAFVREWVDAIAIVPLNPVVGGHVLVIPRTHVADFTTDPVVTGLTMRRAAELAQELGVYPSNLITSAGIEASQSVWHLHAHLVPRKTNDGLALPWWSGRTRKAATS